MSSPDGPRVPPSRILALKRGVVNALFDVPLGRGEREQFDEIVDVLAPAAVGTGVFGDVLEGRFQSLTARNCRLIRVDRRRESMEHRQPERDGLVAVDSAISRPLISRSRRIPSVSSWVFPQCSECLPVEAENETVVRERVVREGDAFGVLLDAVGVGVRPTRELGVSPAGLALRRCRGEPHHDRLAAEIGSMMVCFPEKPTGARSLNATSRGSAGLLTRSPRG